MEYFNDKPKPVALFSVFLLSSVAIVRTDTSAVDQFQFAEDLARVKLAVLHVVVSGR